MSGDVAGAPVVPPARVADERAEVPVVSSTLIHEGRIWDLVGDEVDLGGDAPVVREYIRHTGAVAVIALDDDERVLLLRQYRHPVRSLLWEPPAGLLDVTGEDLRAERWDVLADYYTTPGGSDEAIRIFLARGLSPVPDHELHDRVDEERDMIAAWVPLDEAVTDVLGGRVHNPSAVVGILAAAQARAAGWATLRDVSDGWVR